MKKLITMVPDALIVSGAGALSYGAGLLHVAVGFIVAGALMVAGGVIVARKTQAQTQGATE
jgi:hypothetical protein